MQDSLVYSSQELFFPLAKNKTKGSPCLGIVIPVGTIWGNNAGDCKRCAAQVYCLQPDIVPDAEVGNRLLVEVQIEFAINFSSLEKNLAGLRVIPNQILPGKSRPYLSRPVLLQFLVQPAVKSC